MPPLSTVFTPFDLSPIHPKTIKTALQHCSSSSSCGEDKISYLHLRNMPTCHHILATLYSKILLKTHQAPESWCKGLLKLIPKCGDPSQSIHFRPIALTSVVGKLFHKLLASRLRRFPLGNKIISTTLQKGFLSGINGTLEDIFTITAILENVKQHHFPFSLTVLDLRYAFGSVSHQLIADMQRYLQLPSSLVTYISNVYSKLAASIKTKRWSTSWFPIERGIFQGDTLSPLLFLLVFNPVI